MFSARECFVFCFVASLRSGAVAGIWMGTPCSSFSLARRGRGGSPGGPLRLIGKYILGHPKALRRPKDRKEKSSWATNALPTQLAMPKPLTMQAFLGDLENPSGSRIWHHPAIAKLGTMGSVERRVSHMCAYGMPMEETYSCVMWTLPRGWFAKAVPWLPEACDFAGGQQNGPGTSVPFEICEGSFPNFAL